MKSKFASILLAMAIGSLCLNAVNTCRAQTLINGANQAGDIYSNTIVDSYIFTANVGDSINLRLGTTNFNGRLKLVGPDGATLATVPTAPGYEGPDQLISAYAATNSGVFTVLVSSYDGLTGTYVLNLSQVPEPFIVPAGDGGGPLTNGANATGTITLARQDLWTFTANAGDSINVRLGTTGFNGNLELYAPNGALLKKVPTAPGYASLDQLISYVPTTNGTFTVLVSSYDGDGGGNTGTYVLNLSQVPEPFIVPAGDGGGPLTNGANATGTITLGRQDLWTFTANAGDSINVRLGTTGFNGNLELYAPNGALLKNAPTAPGFAGTNQLIAVTATTNGTFTVLVSSYDGDGGGNTGTYVLNLSQVPGAEYLTWAQHYFGCTTNCSQASEFADTDGSGADNYYKFASGFNPTNSATYPHIISITGTNGNTDIRVNYLGANGDSTYTGGPASRTNVLEFAAGTADGSYSNNFVSTGQTNILSGGTGLGIVTNMVDSGGATNQPARYYRVEVITP